MFKIIVLSLLCSAIVISCSVYKQPSPAVDTKKITHFELSEEQEQTIIDIENYLNSGKQNQNTTTIKAGSADQRDKAIKKYLKSEKIKLKRWKQNCEDFPDSYPKHFPERCYLDQAP
jgi:hypothetical protein